MRLGLLAAVAIGANSVGPATEASAAIACPAGGPCIVVEVVGAAPGTQIVTATQIANRSDLTQTTYPIRSNTGALPEVDFNQGLSVRHLLESLPSPVAPQSVTFTATSTRTAYKSTLTAATGDLTNPSFVGGLLPAFYVDGAEIGYVRPLRGDTDVNFKDNLLSSPNGVVTLEVHTEGAVLHPTVTAKPSTVTAGGHVAFTASIDPATSTAITYHWTFGDGSTADTTTARATHLYSTAGSYGASVVVEGADTSYGQSPAVTISVGKPPKGSAGPHPGTGSSSTTNPSTGPNQRDGHRAGGSVHPESAPTATSAQSGPEAGIGPSTSPPVAHPTGARTDSKPQTGPPTPPASGAVVEGFVIAGPTARASAPAKDAERPPAVAAAAARRSGAERLRLSYAWWLLAPTLLAAGAAAERRRPSGRRPRRVRP